MLHRQQSFELAFIMMKRRKKTSENHFLHITWQYVGFCVAVCVREVGWVGRGKRVRDQQHRTRDLSYLLP